MTINIEVNGQEARYLQIEPVATSDLQLNITFDESWDEYETRTIIARYLETSPLGAEIGEDGKVTVPPQAIAAPGVYLAIHGRSSGGRTISTQEFFIPCQVKADPMTE